MSPHGDAVDHHSGASHVTNAGPLSSHVGLMGCVSEAHPCNLLGHHSSHAGLMEITIIRGHFTQGLLTAHPRPPRYIYMGMRAWSDFESELGPISEIFYGRFCFFLFLVFGPWLRPLSGCGLRARGRPGPSVFVARAVGAGSCSFLLFWFAAVHNKIS